MSAFSCSLYLALTRSLCRAFFALENIRSIYVRRSVAAGEAVFPVSDVDLALVLEPLSGPDLARLARNYRLARALFPRLGECLVFTSADLTHFSQTDPYRASLDHRVCLPVRGPRPVIPVRPISPMEAARRLVFWFEEHIPRALRQANRRNLHKFSLETANALGVLEGRWPEPLASRAETARRWGPIAEDPFEFCCKAAAAAHARLLGPAPPIKEPLQLPGLMVLPEPKPAFRPPKGTLVVTPQALELLMETHNPRLWWRYGEPLRRAGFRPPSENSWRAYVRRWLAVYRLRAPGFTNTAVENVFQRLREVAAILGEPPPRLPSRVSGAVEYYRAVYDELAAWAAERYSQMEEEKQPVRLLKHALLLRQPPQKG